MSVSIILVNQYHVKLHSVAQRSSVQVDVSVDDRISIYKIVLESFQAGIQ
jgi:hypothetical protein